MVVKIGMIGVGTVGKIHLRHCLQLPRARVVAVADTSKTAMRSALNYGVKKVYKSFEEMLSREDLDAVVISTPHFLHCPVATSCAKAGKHILLEKPLARTVDEGRRIIKIAKRNKVKIMVNYHMRFNDKINYLKRIIDDGRIGSIRTMTAQWIGGGPYAHVFKRVPDWWFDVEKTGGGALIDWGGHMIDLSTYLLGNKPSVLYSCIRFGLHMPLEDEAILVLEFSEGAKAIIHVGWFSQNKRQNLTVSGTVRTESLTDFQTSKPSYGQALKNIIRKLTHRPIIHLIEFNRSHFKALEHFVDCVENGKEPSVTGDDALEDLKIVSRAYEMCGTAALAHARISRIGTHRASDKYIYISKDSV